MAKLMELSESQELALLELQDPEFEVAEIRRLFLSLI